MCRDLELAVPGTYDPNQPIIRIQSIAPSLQVITSKQRPRKLTLMGKASRALLVLESPSQPGGPLPSWRDCLLSTLLTFLPCIESRVEDILAGTSSWFLLLCFLKWGLSAPPQCRWKGTVQAYSMEVGLAGGRSGSRWGRGCGCSTAGDRPRWGGPPGLECPSLYFTSSLCGDAL